MYELEGEGLSAKEARKRIIQEPGNNDGNGKATSNESDGRLIEALKRGIQRLQVENQRLWGLVEDLKALPAPKQQRRLFGVFR